MESITIGAVTDAVSGRLICGDRNFAVTSVTTDSRTKNGGLFIALKGERFDANDFVNSYLENNDCAMVSKEMPPVPGKHIIYVPDTNKALLSLAAFYRGLFKIPVIGITGSVGKTSTKEMIYSVVSQKYNAMKTDGNFNNEIGVPLTLFRLDDSVKCAVVEMGMSNFGEMSRLTSAVRPTIAVITNIGTAHIGNLGSRENILKAKLEILEGMDKNSTLILNGDNDLLYPLKGKLNVNTMYYGIKNKDCDIFAENIMSTSDGSDFTVNGTAYHINAPGEHNIYNALSAILIGKLLEIPLSLVQKGIRSFENCGMRQNIIKNNGITLIEDCYNASLDSMAASLKVLKSISKGRSIAVLGDILEQGEFSRDIHTKVGECAAKENIDVLITIGKESEYTAAAAENGVKTVKSFFGCAGAWEYLDSIMTKGDTILFKASRGMKLEEICGKAKLKSEGNNTNG